MENLSIISVIICVVLCSSFIYEACMLIRTINKKENNLGIHALGTIATLLISVMTVCITFGISDNIPVFLIILTCFFGIAFFFIGGLQSVKIEKKK